MKVYFKNQIFSDSYETADRLAMDLIRYTENMLQFRDNLYIAISGGTTPQILYTILVNEYPKAIPWNRIHFFWVDERNVPVDSNESNFGNAYRLLFKNINIPSHNLHAIKYSKNIMDEVVRYTGEILSFVPCIGKYPAFDIIILGMGDDGHTASIFPGQNDLFETNAIVSQNLHPQTGQTRITLTGNVINNAQEIIFLVTGENKAQRVKSIFENSPEAADLPAKKIRPKNGRVSWYLDKSAAHLLSDKI
jgi:6-phosphogluconolactonase